MVALGPRRTLLSRKTTWPLGAFRSGWTSFTLGTDRTGQPSWALGSFEPLGPARAWITKRALGASIALFTKQEALFLIVGAIFVAELFSTLIQERFGLKRGRRIFYRAPLHHTFQHHGLSETKIVARIWIVAAVFGALALITLKIR